MAETDASFYSVIVYGTIILLALAELIIPRQGLTVPFGVRWLTNFTLFGISVLIQRLIMPFMAFIWADAIPRTETSLLGLENFNFFLAVIAGVLLLDCWSYFMHRIEHAYLWLWRLHLVHHSDVNLDFTTTERHHPLEVIAITACFLSFAYLAGIPQLAIAIYLSAATAVSFLVHANINMPRQMEYCLAFVLVTPAVHRIHHSSRREETDSNYGMLFTFWDRIFGTWRAPAIAQAPELGLEYFREPHWGRLDRALLQPFVTLPGRVMR